MFPRLPIKDFQGKVVGTAGLCCDRVAVGGLCCDKMGWESCVGRRLGWEDCVATRLGWEAVLGQASWPGRVVLGQIDLRPVKARKL